MAHAFVGLAPVRFLWAMKQQGLPPGLEQADIPLGNNCMIVPWVDQNVGYAHAWGMPQLVHLQLCGKQLMCDFISGCGSCQHAAMLA
jgi:hypothetical protein